MFQWGSVCKGRPAHQQCTGRRHKVACLHGQRMQAHLDSQYGRQGQEQRFAGRWCEYVQRHECQRPQKCCCPKPEQQPSLQEGTKSSFSSDIASLMDVAEDRCMYMPDTAPLHLDGCLLCC